MATMTNSQRLLEARKKREEEAKNSSSASGVYRNSDKILKARLERTIGLNSFESDLANLNTTLTGVVGGWQTGETMVNTKKSLENMYNRTTAYQEYLSKYSPDSKSGIGEVSNYYKQILDNWDSLANAYGQYNDADSYTKEKTKLKELYSMSKDDVGLYLIQVNHNGRNPIAYTTYSGQDITWDSLYKEKLHEEMATSKEGTAGWEKYLKDELTTYQKNKKKEENKTWFDEIVGYLGGSFDTTLAGATTSQVISDKRKDTSYMKPTDEWSREEKNIFGAYYLDDPEKAYEYATNLNNTKALAKKGEQKAWIADSATSGFWAGVGHTLASIGTAPMGLSDYMDDLTDSVAGRPIIEESYVSPFEYSQTVQGSIGTELNEQFGTLDESIPVIGGKGWGDVYGTGTSIVQSVLSAYTLGGGGTMVSYFGQGSASAIDDALARGATDEEALAYGTIAGLAEGIPEALGAKGLKELGTADGLKAYLKNVMLQGLDEAKEEAMTSFINQVADNFIMQDKSVFEKNVRTYMANGMSEEEATKKAWAESFESVAYDTLAGMVSGTVHAGVQTPVKTYAENRTVGGEIRANGSADDLKNIASDIGGDSYQKYIERLDSGKMSDAQLGRFYNEVEADTRSRYNSERDSIVMRTVADMANELGGSGNSGLVASAVMKHLDGRRLTEAERTVLKTDIAQGVLENIKKAGISVKDSESFDTASHNLKRTVSVLTAKSAEEKARQESLKKLNTGEKTVDANGNEVTIKGIKAGDGATTLLTNQGEVSVDDMTFSSNDAEIVSYAQNMSEEKANVFLEQYDGKTNVDDYVASFDLAYAYGEGKVDLSKALAYKGVLTEAQVIKAYEAGNIGRAIAKEKAKNEINQKYAGKTFVKGTFNDSIIDYNNSNTDGSMVNWKDLSTKQKNAIRFVKAFSEVTGINIQLIASKVVNGEHDGDNGVYEASTNTIFIDVFAGRIEADSIKDAIVPTLSHEVTHWMKAKAPAMYQKMSEYILETLAIDDKKTLDGMIADEKAELERENPNQEFTDEDAIDELVARGTEDMLANSDKVRKMLAKMSKAEQKSFIAKIKETVENIMNWVNDLLKQYKSDSEEAKLLRQYKERMKKLSKMWDEALTEAIQTNQSMKEGGITDAEINRVTEKVGVGVDMETESAYPSPQFSRRTWTNSEYVQEREKAVDALVKAIGVTKGEAETYIDNINGIAKMIADDTARLDYEPSLDDHATVVKPNSEYTWSVDMSTLCAKRLLFTGTFDEIQRQLPNTALDSDDIVTIRAMMKDAGHEVACGICYVESTRREIGTITNDFIERYKLAQKSGKPISRLNSSGKEVELKESGTQAKFYAEEGYTPTLADLNTTDIDLVKRDHPAVYGAYLSYMNARGQAKPKLLETRAEYKGEILNRFKAKSAVKARNDAGGLRLQSFSDFETPHLIDMMQIITDMSRVGLKSQAYTKVANFAEVFGDTGVKINLSLIAKDSGLDADGNLIFDDVEGINHEEAFRLRDKYSKNVGTILVGKTDEHIIKAMADPRIDYIIPFHKSSWKESLYDALGLTGYDDYTATQNEKPIDKSRTIKNFDPSKYWDFSKSGDENAQIYLEKCKADGRIPKFPQFQNYEGYWKLLIDFKMYDNNGVGSPQTTVMPNFNMEASERILNEYKGGHRNFPVANDVVEKFVSEYKKGHPKTQYSTRRNQKGVDGNLYPTVVELNERDFKKATRNAKAFANYIYENLLNKKIDVYDKEGNVETIEFAGKNEVAKKDGANNPHRVVGKLTQERNNDKKLVIISLPEVIKNSEYIAENAEHTHQWLDENGWEIRRCFVVKKNEDKIYPVILSIGRTRDGRNVLYSANIKKDEGVAIDKDATSEFAKKQTQQAVEIATPSNEKSLTHEEEKVNLSKRDYTSVYELMGEKETLDEENRKLKADIEKLKATIGSEEVKISRFRSLADYLKKLAGSQYNRETLGDALQELYTYVQTTENLQWYNVMVKAEDIAYEMMRTEPNVPANYFKEVMSDIRQDKVSLSDEQLAEANNLYGNYGNLHRALFGRINLVKNGTPLEEQWAKWSQAYPTVFKADISATEMVKELRDIVDALKNTSAIMGEYEHQEAIRHLGMEIYNQLWNIASDSSEAVRKERTAHREMMEELRTGYQERQVILHPVGEIALKYEKLLNSTAQKNRQKNRYDMKRIRELSKKRYEKLIQNVIERDRAEMQRIRELGKKRAEEYKERAEVRATIQKITKNALTLGEWFTKNSKDKHIPEDMKGAVVQLITAIDFSSKQLLGIGGVTERRNQPTNNDLRLAKALSRLYEVADEMNDNRTEESVFMELDIPDSAVNLLKNLSRKALVLNQMNLEELKSLDVLVSTFKKAIITANKNFVIAQNETRERVSNLLIHDADSLVAKKADNMATNFFEYQNATPYYMLKRLGRVGEMIFNGLMDAQEQLVFLEEEIINFVRKTVDGKKIKEWSEEIHEVKILDARRSTKDEPKYKTIKLTTAQIMSIYCLEKRESAKLHLEGGGIRITDIKDGAFKTIKDTEGSSLARSELYAIIGKLTSEQRRVADALQKFMSETGAEWGNMVTMARWDIKQFGEENYFPMATIAQDGNLDNVGKKDNSIYRLLNMSFTKELTPKANNQLIIDNIFDVFSEHMTDMAKYATHALPLLDTMKILGYNRKDFYVDEDGNKSVRHDTVSVASSIRRAFGDNGYRYIINLLKDLNGVEVTPRDEALTKTLMSNYKISAVGGNLRVALLQGSAYIKAGLVMNPKYLTKALATNSKEGIRKAMKHSGIALWKSKGHYDLNIGRSVASEIKQDENALDKFREFSLKGAEWGDKITWGYLWNACELWARDNTPYSYNSAEFNKAVANKLREIIVKTQVVDSTLTRSQMMRSKSAMVQTLTAFMSEATMTYNMVADAFFEWSLDARKEGHSYKSTFAKHGRKFATTMGVFTLTAFTTALAGALVDAMRDDDEEKEFDEKYIEHLFESFGENMNLFSSLPIIKDIVSISQGYSPSRFDEQSFTNIFSGIRKWEKVFNGEGNVYSAFYKTLQGLSQLTGLPASNMVRDSVAMWNSTIGEMYPSLKIEQ